VTDATTEMLRLSRLLDEGIDQLRHASQKLAEMEHAYRFERDKAWATVTKSVHGTKRLAAEIEADVDATCADHRFYRDQAEAARQTALEAIRSRRQQLSAWQSWMAADRVEAELARTAP